MLTSWYNGTKDLEWMRIQQNDLIPRLYKNKYIVHLITWADLPEENIVTPHGQACGRSYPVSSQVIDDMKQLAQIFNGEGLMYVSLFTEFQTYTCTDNNWVGNENYFNTLKDNYRKIKDMTRILGAYGKPVMLAHYKPSNSSNSVFDNDMRSLFTDGVIKDLINNGLFAISFMDSELLDNSET